jgi:acyl-CoA reductase-like NAD-dependent aldehyde dehydrogenase
MASASFQTITPVDGSVYLERRYAGDGEIDDALSAASAAQAAWAATPISERAALCAKAVDAFVAKADRHAEELAWQMGRPIRFGHSEVGGFEERARHMIAIAEEVLADVQVGEKEGFLRYIKRVPLGVVLTVAPWNYPYLTAVNSIVPALMAGNTMILKHASQTPRCGERIADAFAEAGLPDGVFQVLHLSHEATAKIIASDEVDFVAFTGSVPGGASIEKAAAGHFLGVGLELGGTAPSSIPASRAAPSSGSTCTPTSSSPSSRASPPSPANSNWAARSTPGPPWGRWCAPPPPTSCADRSKRRSRRAPRPWSIRPAFRPTRPARRTSHRRSSSTWIIPCG